jgi:predicted metal-binding membrane protein
MTIAAPIERPAPMESLLKRDRAVVVLGMAVTTGLSWAYLVYDAKRMQTGQGACSRCAAMAMPAAGPWSAADLSMLFVMWAVMMVGMMVPSVAPTVLMFAMVNRRRRQESRPYVPAGLFLLGYLIAWAGFSALATVGQAALHKAALLSPMMVGTSPVVGGGLLLLAGLFQWTPIKRACLTHCRSPLTVLMTDWRDGPRGAVVMGVRHGTFCIGCCWLLMALLFVAGVMNLVWVAALTAFVLLEKATRLGPWLGRAGGVLLVGWGAWMMTTGLLS